MKKLTESTLHASSMLEIANCFTIMALMESTSERIKTATVYNDEIIKSIEGSLLELLDFLKVYISDFGGKKEFYKSRLYSSLYLLFRNLLKEGDITEVALNQISERIGIDDILSLPKPTARKYSNTNDIGIQLTRDIKSANDPTDQEIISRNKGLVYLTMGQSFEKDDFLEKSLHNFEEAFDVNTDNSINSHNLALIHWELKNFEESISFSKEAIKMSPDTIQYHDIYILALMKSKDYEAAIDGIKKMLRFFPKARHAYRDLGLCYSNLGDNKKALEALKKGLKKGPDDDITRFALGVQYSLLKKPKVACKHIERAIELYPNHSEYHFTLGVIYCEALGKREMGGKCIDRAIELEPENEEYRNFQLNLILGDISNTPSTDTFETRFGGPKKRN